MTIRTRTAERLAAWARQRHGRDRLPQVLGSRRLYVLPTRAGLGFAALLLLMLIAGLNYGNNLALLLCFMLTGFTLVGMYDTHANLAQLILADAQASPTFAGQRGRLRLQFDNASARARYGLQLTCRGAAMMQFDLAAHECNNVQIEYPAERRGLQRIGPIKLSSTAPLRLFRAWTWLTPELTAIVYPRPLSLRPLPPPSAPRLTGSRRQHVEGTEEWAWLRAYQSGDPPQRIAWKTYARGGPMQVMHYAGDSGTERLFDFDQLPGLDIEQRLSQLTAWILACDAQGAYGLKLRATVLPPSHGPAHQRSCLEALACFGS